MLTPAFEHLMAGIGQHPEIYDPMDPKRKLNSELNTVSAIIRAIAA